MDKETPKKVLKGTTANKFCRICRVDIKGHGRSCVNIFGPKGRNEKIPERLSVVVDEEIKNASGVSENVCQKCYRDFLKFSIFSRV